MSVRSEAGGPGDVATGDVTRDDALSPAKAPVGTGLTPLVGQVAALLLIALGVVGVQEALCRLGVVDTSWTTWTLSHLDRRTATFSMLVLFVVLALVGLGLLAFAFKPRPRKTLTLQARTGVFLRTRDLARIADTRVDGTEGVTGVSAAATRRRLTVDVTAVQKPTDDAAVTRDVESRLRPVLDALTDAPRLSVHITHQDLA